MARLHVSVLAADGRSRPSAPQRARVARGQCHVPPLPGLRVRDDAAGRTEVMRDVIAHGLLGRGAASQ